MFRGNQDTMRRTPSVLELALLPSTLAVVYTTGIHINNTCFSTEKFSRQRRHNSVSTLSEELLQLKFVSTETRFPHKTPSLEVKHGERQAGATSRQPSVLGFNSSFLWPTDSCIAVVVKSKKLTPVRVNSRSLERMKYQVCFTSKRDAIQ